MAAPTGEQINAGMYLNTGAVSGQETIVQQKQYANTLTGNVTEVINKKLLGGATDTQLDLTAFCTTMQFLTIEDEGNTGIDVGIGGTLNKIRVTAGGAVQIAWRAAITPPILYLTNPDGVNAAYIKVGVVGDYS